MQFNYAMQHSALLAWDGASTNAIDIRRHVGFSFTFQVMANLTADTVFNIMAAPPDATDICVPGAFVPVPEVLTCVSDWGAQGGPQLTIVLPKDTPAGSICTAAIPCRPDAFLQVIGASGDTGNVRCCVTLSGPK